MRTGKKNEFVGTASARWRIVPAHADHIPPIAANMREADRREVWASHRHTPDAALRLSLACSGMAWTAVIDGLPAAMWGVSGAGSLLGDIGRGGVRRGVPWLLATPAVYPLWRVFLRLSKPCVAEMRRVFPALENRVHAANKASIRWLKWCGFTVDMKNPVIMNNEFFYTFRG